MWSHLQKNFLKQNHYTKRLWWTYICNTATSIALLPRTYDYLTNRHNPIQNQDMNIWQIFPSNLTINWYINLFKFSQSVHRYFFYDWPNMNSFLTLVSPTSTLSDALEYVPILTRISRTWTIYGLQKQTAKTFLISHGRTSYSLQTQGRFFLY